MLSIRDCAVGVCSGYFVPAREPGNTPRMLLSSTPCFSGILGKSSAPRVDRPGVRSLSWGVWACSAPRRNAHPAWQERPPLWGTACHGVRHACLLVTLCASPCRWFPMTSARRMRAARGATASDCVQRPRHALPGAGWPWVARLWLGRRTTPRPPPATSGARQVPRKALWHSWRTRKPQRIAC
jgi:hypothetical protein